MVFCHLLPKIPMDIARNSWQSPARYQTLRAKYGQRWKDGRTPMVFLGKPRGGDVQNRYFPVGFPIIHWISCGFKGLNGCWGFPNPLDGIGTVIHEVGCYWLGFLDGQCWLSEITSLFLVLVEFTVETITNRYTLLVESASYHLGPATAVARINREHGDFLHTDDPPGFMAGDGKNVSFSDRRILATVFGMQNQPWWLGHIRCEPYLLQWSSRHLSNFGRSDPQFALHVFEHVWTMSIISPEHDKPPKMISTNRERVSGHQSDNSWIHHTGLIENGVPLNPLMNHHFLM